MMQRRFGIGFSLRGMAGIKVPGHFKTKLCAILVKISFK
jgi:hypothetical protein